MNWKRETENINKRRKSALEQGGAENVKRQHKRGRLTIRERLDIILDEGSFDEVGIGAGVSERTNDVDLEETAFTPANFILGFGKITGRLVVIGGEDFTIKGGTPSAAGLRKSVYAEELACQYQVPLIRLHEGAGGSVGGAGGKSLPQPVFAQPRFRSVARAMASVPVASAALGPVAGMPAARLVASHFTVMPRENAQVLVAGPAVVERALGERKTKEELGNAQIHTTNGVVDNIAEDEQHALAQIKRFLSYLPANVHELAPTVPVEEPDNGEPDLLAEIVPRDRRLLYEMRRIIKSVVDRNSFFEMAKDYGSGQITGLARMAGQSVGIWVNDCHHMAGAMTADGAQKVKRFIEFCETFHLPIICLVDEPGFMIGSQAERGGTIRYGASVVLTAAMTNVPWASVVVRKSFGVAQAAHYGPDAYVLAWPSAEMGALPVEGGVAVAFRREIEAADDPEARRRELEAEFGAQRSPDGRAQAFAVHELIDPRETRPMLCRWIERVTPLLPHLLGETSFTIRP